MKILLTGRNGQVGWELERALPALGEVLASDRASLDLADLDAVRRTVRAVKPDIIVNAAAYTAVDKAESEPALAMRINGEAPGVMADEAARLGALLVHYSSDYVFSGDKREPYSEEDAPDPVNAYGRSKLAGELAIRSSGCRHLILRTSWVYSRRGSNFMNTVLRLAREKGELRIVGDQVGGPTPAAQLASATQRILGCGVEAPGTFHLSCSGSTTWYDFAREIVACSGMGDINVIKITSAEYPAAARRPSSSVLLCDRARATFGVSMPNWRDALAQLWSIGART